MRKALIKRETSETKIMLEMDLDNPIRSVIKTGSGFLDHMLDLYQVHSNTSLKINCKGDVHIDLHHSVEDIGICFGEALLKCLGNKKGIERYGFYYIPMEDALSRVVIDLSGRYEFQYNVKFPRQKIGDIEAGLIKHFFQSIAENAKMNLHIDLIRGKNPHHCIESVFKAFARAMSMAISEGKNKNSVPSSKGIL